MTWADLFNTAWVSFGDASGAVRVAVSNTVAVAVLPALTTPDLAGLDGRTFGLTDEISFSYPVSGVTFGWSFTVVTGAGGGATSASAAAGALLATTSMPRFTPAGIGLSPGTYQLFVTVTRGSEGREASARVTLAASDLAGVKVYPNPWRQDRHAAHPAVTFAGLTMGTTIKIFTASGHKIKELRTDGPRMAWDLTNDSGTRVASGLYLYLISDGQGHKARGKMAVIR